LVGSIFHMTRKIVSEMTYNVSMGTLNPTIPYQCVVVLHRVYSLYEVVYKIHSHADGVVTCQLHLMWFLMFLLFVEAQHFTCNHCGFMLHTSRCQTCLS